MSVETDCALAQKEEVYGNSIILNNLAQTVESDLNGIQANTRCVSRFTALLCPSHRGNSVALRGR